jgi:hypothetical protein
LKFIFFLVFQTQCGAADFLAISASGISAREKPDAFQAPRHARLTEGETRVIFFMWDKGEFSISTGGAS